MAPDDASIPSPWDSGRLDDRVLAMLEGTHGEVAFNGLRRLLRAHPESLTRALRRLEREGLVLRVLGGYRAMRPPGGSGPDPTDPLRTVADVELPAHIAPSVLAGRLSGRWFGTLRWVGVVDRPDGRRLAWAPRSGRGIVLLAATSGRLRVQLPDGLTPADAGDAEEAAFELLFHAVEAMRELGVRPSRLSGTRALSRTDSVVPLDN